MRAFLHATKEIDGALHATIATDKWPGASSYTLYAFYVRAISLVLEGIQQSTRAICQLDLS